MPIAKHLLGFLYNFATSYRELYTMLIHFIAKAIIMIFRRREPWCISAGEPPSRVGWGLEWNEPAAGRVGEQPYFNSRLAKS